MSIWSDKFNSLPFEVRTIGFAVELQTRIQHLDMEAARLIKSHKRSLREIADYRKGCVGSLKLLDDEANKEIGDE